MSKSITLPKIERYENVKVHNAVIITDLPYNIDHVKMIDWFKAQFDAQNVNALDRDDIYTMMQDEILEESDNLVAREIVEFMKMHDIYVIYRPTY